ncbi:uL15 family ribosomal protein [Candidatus Woesearchaeota archaeon]|nr:uL15 family ribosomal protein [Candidatus Woesearchaeota archaeon]
MVVHRNKKMRKFRGSTTHGWGSRKKHRGSGSRGGSGKAGSGKRAGHKKQHHTLGAHGFLPRRATAAKIMKGINLGDFTLRKLDLLVKEKKITKQGETYHITLTSLGYGKLLGTGNTEAKLNITAPAWSASAEQKVKAAGGEIVSGNKVHLEKAKKE